MQLWYLAGLGDQVISLQLDFAQHIDEDILSRATQLLLASEPVLVSRLEVDLDPPQWLPLPQQAGVVTVTDDVDAYEALRVEEIDAACGPQIAIVLLHRDVGDRVLLRVTHHVTDAGGLREIGERLADFYTHVAVDPDYEPPPATQGSRGVDQFLRRLPRLTYMRLLVEVVKLHLTLRLPRPVTRPSPINLSQGRIHVIRQLPAACVSELADYGRARGATLNDLLLSAYSRALASDSPWPGVRPSPLATTVDLRRWYDTGAALSNLSSGEILQLKSSGADFPTTLAEVSRLMGQRKRHQIGLPLALLSQIANPVRRQTNERISAQVLAARSEAPMPWLSNLGLLDKQRLCFAGMPPAAGHLLTPAFAPPWLEVGLSGFDRMLTLSVGTTVDARPQAEALLDAIVSELPASGSA